MSKRLSLKYIGGWVATAVLEGPMTSTVSSGKATTKKGAWQDLAWILVGLLNDAVRDASAIETAATMLTAEAQSLRDKVTLLEQTIRTQNNEQADSVKKMEEQDYCQRRNQLLQSRNRELVDDLERCKDELRKARNGVANEAVIRENGRLRHQLGELRHEIARFTEAVGEVSQS
jgi:predicted  nucleic acid-binding Zn-ribbon protein